MRRLGSAPSSTILQVYNSSKLPNDVSMQDVEAAPIVIFYLSQDNPRPPDCLPIRVANLDRISVQSPCVGEGPDKATLEERWKVTISPQVGLQQPACLVTFGSDPQESDIILDPRFAPIYFRIYAQLNSGPDVFVLEDFSDKGTWYQDGAKNKKGQRKLVHRCRKAAQGLRVLYIGPYTFHIHLSENSLETAERDHWFRRHQPVLVSRAMLERQLRGVEPTFLRLQTLGAGSFGIVSKVMERTTGLMLAIKEQTVDVSQPRKETRGELIRKEIENMQNLDHPHIVEFIGSHSEVSASRITWTVVMPWFRCSLQGILPQLNLDLKKKAILQVVLGLRYMHSCGLLHRDVKPDNIFVSEWPLKVVLGDLGLASTMKDRLVGRGTGIYMAPEAHHNVLPTTAIDVFALGVTFFQMIDSDRTDSVGLEQSLLKIGSFPPIAFPSLICQMIAPIPDLRPNLGDVMRCLEQDKDLPHDHCRPHPSQVPTKSRSPVVCAPFVNLRGPGANSRRVILAPIADNAAGRLHRNRPARMTPNWAVPRHGQAIASKALHTRLPREALSTVKGGLTPCKPLDKVDFTQAPSCSPTNPFTNSTVIRNSQDQISERLQTSHGSNEKRTIIGSKSNGHFLPSQKRSSTENTFLHRQIRARKIDKASNGDRLHWKRQQNLASLGQGARDIIRGLHRIAASTLSLTWDMLVLCASNATPNNDGEYHRNSRVDKRMLRAVAHEGNIMKDAKPVYLPR